MQELKYDLDFMREHARAQPGTFVPHAGLIVSGDRLYSLSTAPIEGGGFLTVWDLKTWSAVQLIRLSSGPHWIALSSNAESLLVALEGGEVLVWRTRERVP